MYRCRLATRLALCSCSPRYLQLRPAVWFITAVAAVGLRAASSRSWSGGWLQALPARQHKYTIHSGARRPSRTPFASDDWHSAQASLACAAGAVASLCGLAAARAAGHARAGRWHRSAQVPITLEPEVDPQPPRKDDPDQPEARPVRMPLVDTGSGTFDVMSRLMQDRILMLSGQVNDETANVLIAQMLHLANQDAAKDITIYINSPGGSVSAGMAIFDSMQLVPCDVSTVCFGMAASMGAFLLGAGTKGKRKCLPNARVVIHQPLGGAGGQAADIEIQAQEILFLREILNMHLADFTGQTMDKIKQDCDRDYFMTAEEAVQYGLVDHVIETRSWPRLKKPEKPTI